MYLIHLLDPIVKGDYVIAYFHTLTTSSNYPSFSWLRDVYSVLPYKYKKNLKAFYIVHPTFWTKVMSSNMISLNLFNKYNDFVKFHQWLSYILKNVTDDDMVVYNVYGSGHKTEGAQLTWSRVPLFCHVTWSTGNTCIHNRIRYVGKNIRCSFLKMTPTFTKISNVNCLSLISTVIVVIIYPTLNTMCWGLWRMICGWILYKHVFSAIQRHIILQISPSFRSSRIML